MSSKTNIFIKLFLTLSLIVGMLGGRIVNAANVGFVPSTGIWFSDTSVSPGQTTQIYTAIINNAYNSLGGSVSFYDNNQVIGTSNFENLIMGDAALIHIGWTPTAGQHTLSARFTKAVATDSSGKQSTLSLSDINSVSGAPLAVNNSTVNPVVPEGQITQTLGNIIANVVGGATSTRENVPVGAITVDVQKVGGALAINNPSYIAKDSDAFAKNREILGKAGELMTTITSTAGKIDGAYTSGKEVVSSSQPFIEKAKTLIATTQFYIQKGEPYWNQISDNNNPKRIALIVGGVLILYIIVRLSFRRRRGVFN